MAVHRPEPAPPTAPADTPPLPVSAGPHPTGYREMGYVFAAVGALAFSTKAVVIKLAYEETIDPETLLALRMAFAMPFYLVIGALSVRDHRREDRPLPNWRQIAGAAAVGLLGYWFASYMDFLGLVYITAQFERLILFTYPMFVVIFGALFFKQPIRAHTVAGIAISYAGLAAIFGEKLTSLGSDVVLGATFVLLAAIAFALYQLVAKPLIQVIGPRLFTCIAMSGAAAGAFIQFFLTQPASALIVSPLMIGYAIMLAVGATVLPSFFLNAALHRISAQANATIGTLSPVMTIVLAVLILGETLTTVDVIGTALVLAGVGWFTFADQRAKRDGTS
ncbi:DMT family transporter [Bauldia sp.]|uniref:DMT family transporter n=1 Tax=Bauldia sp. TaxID=2575872 RepID=UPI003BA918ED